MYDLAHFGLVEMIQSGRELRALGSNAKSMDKAAQQITDLFYNSFVDAQGRSNFALVRCFSTHLFASLPLDLRDVTLSALGSMPPPSMLRCLCLLASCGCLPLWNDRVSSEKHRAIPLLSEELALEAPMISRLFLQMGFNLSELSRRPLDGEHVFVDGARRTFNVFHVEYAEGSPYVPAQQTFVQPHGIRSVIGFGGVLPSHEFFAIVMFSKVRISRETAELFRTLALGAKLVLLPFAGRQVFA